MASVRYDGNKNVIGTQLRILRKKLNLKQGELKMQVLGFTMDQQAVSNIERNRRVVTDFELAGFCKALRCSETDLLQDFYEKLND